MESLRAVTQVLDSILVPKPGYTNETRVYSPDPLDMSAGAELKRDLIKNAHTILDAARARLAGAATHEVSVFDGTESDRVEEILADDPERRDFQELIHHAVVAQGLLSELQGPFA